MSRLNVYARAKKGGAVFGTEAFGLLVILLLPCHVASLCHPIVPSLWSI
jgi:hypothetical protein